MNELLIPPLCNKIKTQLHISPIQWSKVIKRIFKKNKEELIKARIRKITRTKHVILCDSGSTALTVGLKALNDNRDEVIMQSFACKSVINSVLNAGLTPVLVDINKDFMISTEEVRKACNDRTLAVISIHMFGKVCDFSELNRMGCFVIDDKATRLQGKMLGDFGILSFNIGKQIQSTGGGALITNDDLIAKEAERLITESQSFYEMVKQLVVFLLTVEFRKFTFYVYEKLVRFGVLKREERIDKRYKLVKTTKTKPKKINLIQKILTLQQLDDVLELFHKKHRTLTTTKRYQKAQQLTKQGKETDWVFWPLHLQPKYQKYKRNTLTNTEEQWKQTLTIPTNRK